MWVMSFPEMRFKESMRLSFLCETWTSALPSHMSQRAAVVLVKVIFIFMWGRGPSCPEENIKSSGAGVTAVVKVLTWGCELILEKQQALLITEPSL